MQPSQQMVLEFHRRFGLTTRKRPELPSSADMVLRLSLLWEELNELADALAIGDLVGVADALADLQYVLDGAAVTFGIDLEPLIREVHRSNMTKVWPDGEVHKNAEGKVLKPATYSPANLEPIIKAQGYLYE